MQARHAAQSSSFLKKRSKKLLIVWAELFRERPKPRQIQIFCFFFSKKKAFLWASP
jgi:hypothetical protein